MADNVTLPGTGVAVASKDIGGGLELQQVMAGALARPSANFTRPANATPYVVGQTVANSTTAGSVAPLSFTSAVRFAAGSGIIRRAKIRKSSTGITNASFRLKLYSATFTSASGDGATESLPGVADYLGKIDVTMDDAFTDGACGVGIPSIGSEIGFKLPSGTTVFGILSARGAYTPVSGETFTVELEIAQD